MKKKPKARVKTEERRTRQRLVEKLTVVKVPSKYILEDLSFSRDISEKGICLLSPTPIEINTRVELGIYLPEYKLPVIVKGTVIRCKPVFVSSLNCHFELGVKFTFPNPEVYHQIKNHIWYNLLKPAE